MKGEKESFQEVCRGREDMPVKARDKGAMEAEGGRRQYLASPPKRLVELNGAASRTSRVDCDIGS